MYTEGYKQAEEFHSHYLVGSMAEAYAATVVASCNQHGAELSGLMDRRAAPHRAVRRLRSVGLENWGCQVGFDTWSGGGQNRPSEIVVDYLCDGAEMQLDREDLGIVRVKTHRRERGIFRIRVFYHRVDLDVKS